MDRPAAANQLVSGDQREQSVRPGVCVGRGAQVADHRREEAEESAVLETQTMRTSSEPMKH